MRRATKPAALLDQRESPKTAAAKKQGGARKVSPRSAMRGSPDPDARSVDSATKGRLNEMGITPPRRREQHESSVLFALCDCVHLGAGEPGAVAKSVGLRTLGAWEVVYTYTAELVQSGLPLYTAGAPGGATERHLAAKIGVDTRFLRIPADVAPTDCALFVDCTARGVKDSSRDIVALTKLRPKFAVVLYETSGVYGSSELANWLSPRVDAYYDDLGWEGTLERWAPLVGDRDPVAPKSMLRALDQYVVAAATGRLCRVRYCRNAFGVDYDTQDFELVLLARDGEPLPFDLTAVLTPERWCREPAANWRGEITA